MRPRDFLCEHRMHVQYSVHAIVLRYGTYMYTYIYTDFRAISPSYTAAQNNPDTQTHRHTPCTGVIHPYTHRFVCRNHYRVRAYWTAILLFSINAHWNWRENWCLCCNGAVYFFVVLLYKIISSFTITIGLGIVGIFWVLFCYSPPPPHQTLTYANGCGVNTIGTWTNLIKFSLILQHIGHPIECVNARF